MKSNSQALVIKTVVRVFMFLHTDDFWRNYITIKEKGIEFNSEPRSEKYGAVVVFKDLYGNLWDMIGPEAFFS